MTEDLYQKGINKIQELTASPDSNPTGFPSVLNALTVAKQVFAEEGVTVDTSAFQ